MSLQTTYHIGGYDPAAVAQNRREEWDTGSSTYTSWDQTGKVLVQRALTAQEQALFARVDAEIVDAGNADLLLAKVQAAIADNTSFLAIAAPNNSQNAAQLQRITHQVTALLRLKVGALSDTTGT